MRCYGLRAALFAAALCAAALSGASLWLGLVGAAAVSALLSPSGGSSTFIPNERCLPPSARVPSVRWSGPTCTCSSGTWPARPGCRCPGCSCRRRRSRTSSPSGTAPAPRRSAAPRDCCGCCPPTELRAVLAHELAHVARRDVAVSSWSAGLASLVASCPLIAVLLHITAPSGREYGADIDSALLTGDPMALASALRKIDTATAAQPLRPHGTLAAASHLMIAHPFPPDGLGGMLSTHPPTSERVRRLEALSGAVPLPGG